MILREVNGPKAPKVAQDKVPSSPRLIWIASTLLFPSGYALEYSEVWIEECCNGLSLTEFKLLLFMCMYVCLHECERCICVHSHVHKWGCTYVLMHVEA